jgi:hypothetical protein
MKVSGGRSLGLDDRGGAGGDFDNHHDELEGAVPGRCR